jgi:mannose-6-phosphate isomerase-like protein (cupin superfamily)
MERRPWGTFKTLQKTETYHIKEIEVDPFARLSLQSHEKREEHWYVLFGRGIVTLNEKEIKIQAGESINIPLRAIHRIYNPNDEPLIFIEVQTGTYFGEDDIVRYEDDYNRI